MMKVYIINYTPFKSRLEETLDVALKLGFYSNIQVVNLWDKENLPFDVISQSQVDIWSSRIRRLLPVLLFNAGFDSNIAEDSVIPQWALPRELSRGEISVLMKHFYAIADIAAGEDQYGIIFEDDIRINNDMVDIFWDSIRTGVEMSVDYLDLAGGCGLSPRAEQTSYLKRNLAFLSLPRTRTSAGYLLSKVLASRLANNFFPLVFPIDWHIQYLMLNFGNTSCAWTINPVLIHGSEAGSVLSWRHQK